MENSDIRFRNSSHLNKHSFYGSWLGREGVIRDGRCLLSQGIANSDLRVRPIN